MKKFSVHPLFWIYMFIEVLCGNYSLPIVTLASAILHELGHGAVATANGYTLGKLNITPFGAALSLEQPLHGKTSVPIILAGPIVSLLIALLTVATWWIFPTSYPYTMGVFKVNIALAAFNILPAYPLDGGRLILAIAKNKKLAKNIVKFCGMALGFIAFILGIVSLFLTPNYSLMLIGAMLVYFATDKEQETEYMSLAAGVSLEKDWSKPIVQKTILAKGDVKLGKLLKELNRHEEMTFVLFNDSNHSGRRKIGERDFVDLCLKLAPCATVEEAVRYLQRGHE